MGAATLAGTYQYAAGTNQLTQILNANNLAVGYTYNEIGQMVAQKEQPSGPTSDKYLDYDVSGKVTAIYADANRTRVVGRYTYDEFGRRLIQQAYPNPLDQSSFITTTFVRDGAGHELASYVATTTPAVTNPSATLYEQPIYGATRLGIYRRARDQSPAEQLYELNDQLGNTRIVFRQPVTTTYALSLEDARVNQEKQDFPGPTATTYTDTRSSEHYYAASFYNASTGLHYSTKLTGQQGPTKTILAQRGDKIDLSVYAAYLSPAGTVTNSFAPVLLPLSATSRQNTVAAPATETAKPVTGLARALSNLSVGVAIPFGQTTQRTMATQGLPQAALQYVILKADDNSPVANGTGTVLVDANGQGNWEQLQLSVTITQNYPVKVVISTQNYDGTQPVYFDDLTVNYTAGPIVEENHYYAYGQRNEGLSWRRTDERLYGRGYQGQNTTQDAESSYTAFDLRMYDARYGRWLMGDPNRQYSSPYVGMGNNPISRSDTDGGFDWYYTSGADKPVWIDGTGEQTGYLHLGSTFTGGIDQGTGYALGGDAAGNYTHFTSEVVVDGTNALWDLRRSGYYAVSNGGQAAVAFAGEFIATAGAGEILGAIKIGSKATYFYRAMSAAEFAGLEGSGGLSAMAGRELFVSTSAKYSSEYLTKPTYDVLVQFSTKPAALDAMAGIGVRNGSGAVIDAGYGYLPKVGPGWMKAGYNFFKGEKGVLNIGLGSNPSVFNSTITGFKIIP